MFCPKCGQQNPETGKFCRGCGTDLGNVSQALSAPAPQPQLLTRKGRAITYHSALMKIFTGLAFGAVAAALAITGAGRGWWFWLLIPAIMSLGSGAAQWVQLDKSKAAGPTFASGSGQIAEGQQGNALPPMQASGFVPVESRYKTGDLVPPSVTDGTTRHLEMDSEGKTMTLPKQ